MTMLRRGWGNWKPPYTASSATRSTLKNDLLYWSQLIFKYRIRCSWNCYQAIYIFCYSCLASFWTISTFTFFFSTAFGNLFPPISAHISWNAGSSWTSSLSSGHSIAYLFWASARIPCQSLSSRDAWTSFMYLLESSSASMVWIELEVPPYWPDSSRPPPTCHLPVLISHLLAQLPSPVPF